MDTKRLLNSVGKEIFINYFHDFKNYNDKKRLAHKLLTGNPNATSLRGQIIRINCAIRIIDDKNALEDALNLIINSNRMSDEIIEKACQIKHKELNKK